MKLFVFASRFPYPLERGDKLRLYHQIKGLSPYFSIYLYAICDHTLSQNDYDEVAQFCKKISICKVNLTKKLWNVFKTLSFDLPLQASTIYMEGFHQKILDDAKIYKPDVIYCQLIRMAPYTQGLKAHKVLDYMDAYGVGMMRRSGITRGLNRYLYRYEAKKTLAYESKIYSEFDQHCIISEQDAKLLPLELNIIPNGIDISYFYPRNHTPNYDIGFIGNMGYLPNVKAVEVLCQEILPLYHEKHYKTLNTLIAGARPHTRVLKLKNDRVTITGWVNDIRDAYQNINIICAPINSGTGQQNKILEAMAMGIPCITTSSVNAAIGAEHKKNILIANNNDQFVEAIFSLLYDKKLYQKISLASRIFVKENFSWESSLNNLRSLLNSKQ